MPHRVLLLDVGQPGPEESVNQGGETGAKELRRDRGTNRSRRRRLGAGTPVGRVPAPVTPFGAGSGLVTRSLEVGVAGGTRSAPLACLPDPVEPGCVHVRVLRCFHRVDPSLEPVELAVQRPHVVRQEQDRGCCDRSDCRCEDLDWCRVHAQFLSDSDSAGVSLSLQLGSCGIVVSSTCPDASPDAKSLRYIGLAGIGGPARKDRAPMRDSGSRCRFAPRRLRRSIRGWRRRPPVSARAASRTPQSPFGSVSRTRPLRRRFDGSRTAAPRELLLKACPINGGHRGGSALGREAVERRVQLAESRRGPADRPRASAPVWQPTPPAATRALRVAGEPVPKGPLVDGV